MGIKTLYSKFLLEHTTELLVNDFSHCRKCGCTNSALNLLCSECGRLIFGNEKINSLFFIFIFLFVPLYLSVTMLLSQMVWPLHVYLSALSIIFFVLFFRNIPRLLIVSLSWMVPFLLLDILNSYFTNRTATIYLSIFQVSIAFFVFYHFVRWVINFYKSQHEYRFIATVIIASILLSLFFWGFSYLAEYVKQNYGDRRDLDFIFMIASYSETYFKIRILFSFSATIGIIINASKKYQKFSLIKTDKFDYIYSFDGVAKQKISANKTKSHLTKLLITIYLNFVKIIQDVYNLIIRIANRIYNFLVTFYRNFVNLIYQVWIEIRQNARVFLNLMKQLVRNFILPLILVVTIVYLLHFIANLLPSYINKSTFGNFAKIISLLLANIFAMIYLATVWCFDLEIDASIKESINLSGNAIRQKIYEFLAKTVPMIALFIIIVIPIFLFFINRYFAQNLNFEPSYFSFSGAVLILLSAYTLYRNFKQGSKNQSADAKEDKIIEEYDFRKRLKEKKVEEELRRQAAQKDKEKRIRRTQGKQPPS